MELPLRISFRGLDHSDAIEGAIRTRAIRLERIYDRITGCQVSIEAPHHRHHKGNLFRVRIDLTVPREEIAVKKGASDNPAHSDLYVAIRDAFDAAERCLEDYARRRRHEVKTHAPAATRPPEDEQDVEEEIIP